SELDLSNWIFERCNLRHTKLSGAKLVATKWLSCRGPFCNFAGANLSEAAFRSSDFNNAVFRRAAISSAIFESCKLTGADLSDVNAFDINFKETLLVGAKMSDLSFRRQLLIKLD